MNFLKTPFVLLIFSLFGCVSVDIASNKKTQKSNFVQFSTPPVPFEEIKTESGDKTWLSGKTGNTISFLSECNSPAEQTLEELLKDSVSFINNKKSISTSTQMFNQRSALHSRLTGNVDGVDVEIYMILFRKNQCSYILSYGGTQRNFENEFLVFKKFLEDFRVTQ